MIYSAVYATLIIVIISVIEVIHMLLLSCVANLMLSSSVWAVHEIIMC